MKPLDPLAELEKAYRRRTQPKPKPKPKAPTVAPQPARIPGGGDDENPPPIRTLPQGPRP